MSLIQTYRGDSIDHQGKESFEIFKPTQIERAKNLVFRLGKALGVRGEWLQKQIEKHDYYYGMNESDYAPIIYSKDKPLSLEPEVRTLGENESLPAPTSYWLGHATLLLGISVRSDSDPSKATTLRVITDPVEGDLAPVLYPRMTKFAKSMEKIPPPQVYLLSHNHFDHYSSKTIDKLVSQQPVMIVPKGDGYRYLEKGFKHVQELDWWESAEVKFEQGGEIFTLDVNAVPARHWAGQGPCGGHESTFLGYVVKNESGDVYFAGDTARLDDKKVPAQLSEAEKQLRGDLAPQSSGDVAAKAVERAKLAQKAAAQLEIDKKAAAKLYKKQPMPNDVSDRLKNQEKIVESLITQTAVLEHVFELKSLSETFLEEAGKKKEDIKNLEAQVDEHIKADPQISSLASEQKTKLKEMKNVQEDGIEALQAEIEELRKQIATRIVQIKASDPKVKSLLAQQKGFKDQAAYLEKQSEIARTYALTGEDPQISHVDTLRDLFNIKYSFQPGGPDEVRKSMQSTHQASVDSLWMHSKLLWDKLYQPGMKIEEFAENALKTKTVIMHTMTYKLGNLKLWDTPVSLSNVLAKLRDPDYCSTTEATDRNIEDALKQLAEKKYPFPKNPSAKQEAAVEKKREALIIDKRDKIIEQYTGLKSYEWQVFRELLNMSKSMEFDDDQRLTPWALADILETTVIVPKIGSNLDLGESKINQTDKVVF